MTLAPDVALCLLHSGLYDKKHNGFFPHDENYTLFLEQLVSQLACFIFVITTIAWLFGVASHLPVDL